MASTSAFAQRKKKFEATFGLGATNFYGELGGANQIGRDYFYDYDLKANRPVINLGLRYQTCEFAAVKTNLFYGLLKGSDQYTKEQYRNNRNLSFRSPVFEFSSQVEISFLKDKGKNFFKVPWVYGKKVVKVKKGKRNGVWDYYPYGFVGIGVFYFNPKAQYNGKWTALQPLGTEGQGLNGTEKYKKIGLSIPYGVGLKYKVDNLITVSLDVGVRKTFTDYIDDVSGDYYDKAELNRTYGPVSAALSDPSLGDHPNWTVTGEQRGDPTDKDSYLFAVVSVNYRFQNFKQLYQDLFKKKLRPKF
ncbi:MAG: hypothetical protein V4667_07445 [Bacteroidota bacterium]